MAPQGPHALSWDRMTHNISVQGLGKSPHPEGKHSKAFWLQSSWEFKGDVVGSEMRKRIPAGWSMLPRVRAALEQALSCRALGTPTLHDRMFPKAENVSYRALLSMESSRFLMKMFPTPDFLRPGSRWDHMIRMGRPLITSKFMVSKARSAGKEGGGVGSKRQISLASFSS